MRRCAPAAPGYDRGCSTRSDLTLPKPLLILHIGPHKTGSTALQLRLITARDHLSAHGYEYPLLGISQYAHHRLNAFLYSQPAEAQDVTEDSLRALAASGKNVILSSEDLIYQTAEALERLKALLDAFRVQAVMFIRTPVELWPSHWQELVKFGHQESFLEYLGACFGVNAMINALQMSPIHQAQRFIQVFGRANVRIFCYNNIVADGIDLFEFFLDAVLHVPPVLPRLPTIVMNPSLQPHIVELLRCLNERFHHQHLRTPGSSLTAVYYDRRAEVESHPAFMDFCAAFELHARTVTLDSANEFFRRRENQLVRLLGDRIENRAAADRVYHQQYSKTLPYGTPFWADRFGFSGFVAEVLALLA
jgi:hypothetical protein